MLTRWSSSVNPMENEENRTGVEVNNKGQKKALIVSTKKKLLKNTSEKRTKMKATLVLLLLWVGMAHGFLLGGHHHRLGAKKLHMTAMGGEPAGVEKIFTEAKRMRKAQLRRLAEKAKSGHEVLMFRVRGKRRRREKARQALQLEGQSSDFERNLRYMKNEVSLRKETWQFENEHELEALAEMKLILEDDFKELANKTVSTPGGREFKPLQDFKDVYGDIRLLRFLRKDRNQDPVSAALSYKKFLRWRAENKVDQIRAQVEDHPFEVPKKLHFIADLVPCDFNIGEDLPNTVTLHLGKWRIPMLSSLIREQEVSLTDFLSYWIYIFESVHMLLNTESVRQQRVVFVDGVSDLKGFSVKMLSPAFVSDILRPWVKVLQSNYPETAKRIDVINSPRVVSILWRLIVPLLSPGTVAKIRIH